MLISAVIDIDLSDNGISEWANENTDTYANGVYGVDEIGVYHMYHHSRTDLVTWMNPRPLNSEVEEKSIFICDNCIGIFRKVKKLDTPSSAAEASSAAKVSCDECWSQKQYCEECAAINALNDSSEGQQV